MWVCLWRPAQNEASSSQFVQVRCSSSWSVLPVRLLRWSSGRPKAHHGVLWSLLSVWTYWDFGTLVKSQPGGAVVALHYLQKNTAAVHAAILVCCCSCSLLIGAMNTQASVVKSQQIIQEHCEAPNSYQFSDEGLSHHIHNIKVETNTHTHTLMHEAMFGRRILSESFILTPPYVLKSHLIHRRFHFTIRAKQSHFISTRCDISIFFMGF